MVQSTERNRGRPFGSKTVPSDLGAEIWNRVRIYRIMERIRTKKTPSVAKACEEIMAKTGVLSAVGGNPGALAYANLTRKKRWRRFRLDQDDQLVEDIAGAIFIHHRVASAGALHARFSEANKLVKSSALIRLNWMNLGRQMMGRPIKSPRWANPPRISGRRLTGDPSPVPNAN